MGSARVLVVEDNQVNLELVVALLEAEDCTVISAGTGEEGIRRALQERPDLIFMDIQLPEATGYEVTRRLKQEPATARIPVVALTAQAMKGDRERALAAGCDEYCPKPLDVRRFREIVRRFLSPRQDGATGREEGAGG